MLRQRVYGRIVEDHGGAKRAVEAFLEVTSQLDGHKRFESDVEQSRPRLELLRIVQSENLSDQRTHMARERRPRVR